MRVFYERACGPFRVVPHQHESDHITVLRQIRQSFFANLISLNRNIRQSISANSQNAELALRLLQASRNQPLA